VQTNSGVSSRITVWGPWGTWSPCSKTCGFGKQSRRRNCEWGGDTITVECDKLGNQQKTETRDCENPACCKQSESYWGDWSFWSSCSSSCGPAKQHQSRLCHNIVPSCLGKVCSGISHRERSCSNPDPVDGTWEDWNPWSGCSVSCGLGRKTRTRTCSFPSACHGKPCEGNAGEARSCNLGCCNPVDGSWSVWTSWSNCSASCGLGKKFRNHTCTFSSDCHGRECEGSVQEEEICHKALCVTNEGNSAALLGASIVGGVFLIIVVVALLICVYKMGKRRGNLQQHPTKVEDNPLYGTYGVNGDQNDYTTVQDTNDYYF